MQNEELLLDRGTPPLPPHPPPPPPSPPPPPPYDAIYELNRNPVLDFQQQYNRLYNDENLNDDPYSNFNIASKYHDLSSISHLCANGQRPAYLYKSKYSEPK
jgi:hypothetical protein